MKKIRIRVRAVGCNFGFVAEIIEVGGKRATLYETDVMPSRHVAEQFAEAHAEARGFVLAF